MTPEKLAALGALARRALTDAEIALADARQDAELAASLSAGRTRLVPMEVGVGTILAAFAGSGGQFLDTLDAIGQANRDIHWLLNGVILRGAFDPSVPASRDGMVALAAQLPQFAAGINALLAMAEQADPVAVGAVSDILNAEAA